MQRFPERARLNEAWGRVSLPRYRIFEPMVVAVFFGLLLLAGTARAAAPDYQTDVAPVFREYCAGCHSGDDPDGAFSLETFELLMKGGESGPAVVPGKASDSLLHRLVNKLEKPSMPPKREPQPGEAQKNLLRAWIDAGAPGPADPRQSLMAALTVPKVEAMPGTPRALTAAAYSPDGATLALARFQSVEWIDAKSGKLLRRLTGAPGKVNRLDFSADGKRLAAASGVTGLSGVALLWDLGQDVNAREIGEGHRDILFDAAFSPDGTLLATAGYDRRIQLWKVADGSKVREIEGHNGAVFDLAWSPDGLVLASASGDETVKLWQVATGLRLDTLNQPQGEQFAVTFTPDGKHILAAGADNRIRLWRFISREKPRINPLLEARFAHEDDILTLALSADGREVYSASADRSVKRWFLPALNPAGVLADQPDLVSSLAATTRRGTVLATRMDGSRAALHFEAPQRKPGLTGKDDVARAVPPSNLDLASKEPKTVSDAEPNDRPKDAHLIALPAMVQGRIDPPGDEDLFKFEARAGSEWVIEVEAARKKSPLDSKVALLRADGSPVEQVVLQAMRDSWFTFRGKDSDTSNDFRVHNWREMELNEYLYANGEVVKLWLYPRGPDSGFKVYPGFGNRHTFFGTTALSHPLGEPCYIVRPFPAGTEPSPNGLPVFRLYYENDDEPLRRWGADSQLIFTVPEDGTYLARIGDVRGEGGKNYTYTMKIRARLPDFKVSVGGQNPTVSPGSGREFSLKVDRLDGFEGPIQVDVAGLPPGFSASTPVIIEEGQFMALGVIHAAADAPQPSSEQMKASKVTATALIRGKEVRREIGSLGDIKLGKPAKLLVEILPDGDSGPVKVEAGKPLEFTLAPGETLTARVRAIRNDFKARIELGREDSGRNLPHGVFVDNIGLNGLLIVEDQTERQFFITAAPWVPEMSRPFFLRASADGGQASLPAILHIRRPTPRVGAAR